MDDANRMISFCGIKPPRSVQRSVQKQIDKWIERKKGMLSLHKESRYEVRFEQESAFNSFTSHLRIQIGTCTWESNDVGRSVQEALFLALKHPTIRFLQAKTQIHYFSPAPDARGAA